MCLDTDASMTLVTSKFKQEQIKAYESPPGQLMFINQFKYYRDTNGENHLKNGVSSFKYNSIY